MSGAAFEIISAAGRWQQLYNELSVPSVLASHSYVSAGARLIDGGIAEAAALNLDGDIIFHPYIRRPVPPLGLDYFDLVSPYDFGGFWFSTADPHRRQALASEFERAFGDYAATARIVCEFMRCHPMANVGALEFKRYVLKKHQDNAIVHLDKTIEQIRAGYADNRRPSVKQGIRFGLSLEYVDDASTFMDVYYASLDRYGADSDYYFPASFIDAIKEHLLIAHVRSADGALCAAYLFLVDGRGLYLFLAGSVPDKLPLRPNDFGYDAIIQYAIANKFDYFHLGGGADSLYRYKTSFSPFTVPFYHARCIFLPDAYDELVRRHDGAAPGSRPTNFFPRYRAKFRSARPPSGAQRSG